MLGGLWAGMKHGAPEGPTDFMARLRVLSGRDVAESSPLMVSSKSEDAAAMSRCRGLMPTTR